MQKSYWSSLNEKSRFKVKQEVLAWCLRKVTGCYGAQFNCFKINFFIGYKFLISFADRIYGPVIDQLK